MRRNADNLLRSKFELSERSSSQAWSLMKATKKNGRALGSIFNGVVINFMESPLAVSPMPHIVLHMLKRCVLHNARPPTTYARDDHVAQIYLFIIICVSCSSMNYDQISNAILSSEQHVGIKQILQLETHGKHYGPFGCIYL